MISTRSFIHTPTQLHSRDTPGKYMPIRVLQYQKIGQIFWKH